MKTLFQAPGGRALSLHDEVNGFYVAQFIGQVSGQNYRTALERILFESRHNSCSKVLLNMRDLNSTPDIGKTWLTSQFIPRFYRHTKSLYLAVVKPENRLEKAGLGLLTGIVRTLGLQVNLKFFANFQEAKNWLFAPQAAEPASKVFTKPVEKKISQAFKMPQIKMPKTGIKVEIKFDPKGNLKPK